MWVPQLTPERQPHDRNRRTTASAPLKPGVSSSSLTEDRNPGKTAPRRIWTDACDHDRGAITHSVLPKPRSNCDDGRKAFWADAGATRIHTSRGAHEGHAPGATESIGLAFDPAEPNVAARNPNAVFIPSLTCCERSSRTLAWHKACSGLVSQERMQHASGNLGGCTADWLCPGFVMGAPWAPVPPESRLSTMQPPKLTSPPLRLAANSKPCSRWLNGIKIRSFTFCSRNWKALRQQELFA